jgi:hypothetical protein
MTLEEQLQDAYERAAERAPVAPGAYDRFLRRRARRGRVVAAAAGLALVAVLGAAVLVARQQPQDQEPVAPADGVVRVPQQRFEMPVPAGWKLQRQLTGPGSQVVGVVLVPRSGEPRGAAITVAVEDDQPVSKYAGYLLDLQVDASRRADGRLYKLRAGRAGRLASGKGPVGPYLIAWPVWPPSCRPLPAPAGQRPACRQAALRVLLVTGAAAPGDAAGVQQVLGVMGRVAATVRPTGSALRPPHWLTTKVLLGKGGSGAAAWEAWIERTWLGTADSDGFMVRFPRATPKPTWHWEQLGPSSIRYRGVYIQHRGVYIQHRGVYIQRDCLSWLPGSGLLLSGLAPKDAAIVRIELAGRAPVTVATFGRDQPVPWVAFVSPPLPAGAKLERVVALDAAGRTVGTQARPFGGPAGPGWSPPSCRPRAG